MNWKDFYEKAINTIAFSDGSMGVLLQKYGLKDNECPEIWNLTKEDLIFNIHTEYINAGANLILSNTFGGNRIKLKNYGLENKIKEINSTAIKIAKKAAGNKAIVAGDIGPTGKMVEPLGEITFDEMVDIYREQAEILANAGADVILIETQIDILETKAAIIGVREACDLPIIASVTFEKDGRMMTGTPPDAAFITLEGLNVDIIGTNCGTGAIDMLEIFKNTKDLISTPLIAQANAGIPQLINGNTVFNEGPDIFSEYSIKMIEEGVNVIGGCCGTNPLYIKTLNDNVLKYKPYQKRQKKEKNGLKLSSRFKSHIIGADYPFTIIGERLNPTARKSLIKDLESGSYTLYKEEALKQEEAMCDMLDVNVGAPNLDEAKIMKDVIKLISSTVKIPLVIDTSNYNAAIEGMKVYPGKFLLNSISAENERLKLLKEVKKYGGAFIALPVSEGEIPKTPEKRLKVLEEIIKKAEEHGISKKNIIADPLVLTISSDSEAAKTTLTTIRNFFEVHKINTIAGISNVSFGLPSRPYINRSFLIMAINSGLTSAIMNPFDNELLALVKASDVLRGVDKDANQYIKLYSNQNLITPTTTTSQTNLENLPIGERLYYDVLKGYKDKIKEDLDIALKEGQKAEDILNNYLIKAINEVGNLYEKKIYFLPQLISSAETMKNAFNILEPILKAENKQKLGKIVFATVKGDVHDIGKNIVVLMLRNQGFEVIDLGKDVPNEIIYETALKENADIIGLSALMTTTMTKMKEFMELQKNKSKQFKVMIGGAAVTKEYADEIGAYYSKDAIEAVKLALTLIK